MGDGAETIKRLAREKELFRERDVEAWDISSSCLEDARIFGYVKQHGQGVWSHIDYEPTRYELVQIRLKHAVFWGPSALWLLGVLKSEPPDLWIAVSNKSHRPRNLPLGTVVVRLRHHEQNVTTVSHGVTELRVQTRERAQADIARSNLSSLLSRDLAPRHFRLADEGELLSNRTRSWWSPWSPPPAYERQKPEEWSVTRSIARRKAL